MLSTGFTTELFIPAAQRCGSFLFPLMVLEVVTTLPYSTKDKDQGALGNIPEASHLVKMGQLVKSKAGLP